MKKIANLLLTLSLVFCVLLALPLNASAASTATQNGLEVTITTDKTEYTADEDIQVSVNIKNNNSYKVEDVSIETLLPEGLVLKNGNLSATDIDIEAGASYSASVVAQLSEDLKDNEETQPDDTSKPDDTTKPDNTTKPDDTTKPGGNDQETSSPQTGDNSNIVLWVVLLVASAIGIILTVKFKKTAKMMSLFLCFAMVLTMLPMSAFAAENSTTITVDKTITVDGKEYTIVGKVQKPINDVPENQNTHNVIFALNDGSNGSYEVQMVSNGDVAAKPTDPVKIDYTFTGWYTEKECVNAFDFSTTVTQSFTLYAGWTTPESNEYLFGGASGGGTTFSISGIEMDDEYVRTTINTNGVATLHIQFLDENTNSIITTVTTQTPEYCELTPVSILVGTSLPEKFIIVANLLDSNGNNLCNSFTCISYTTAYENHTKQTVDDFEGQNVINFDESPNKNYGVLNDDVKEIITGETSNKITVSPQPIVPDDYDGTQEIEYENYFIFENPDSQVTNLIVGDKIYIRGTQHLIKIASIETSSDGTIIMTASKDVELPDFYKVLSVDMEIDVNEAEIDNSGTMVIWDIIDAESSFPLGGTIKFTPTDWLEIEGKLNGTGTVKVEVKYDLKWFEKDYFYISVVSELELNFNADIKVTKDNSDDLNDAKEHKDLTEIKLGKWTIPTPVPGLTISTTPFIPLEWELSAGVTFDFNSKTTSGFSYSSYDGKQNIDKKERTIKVGAEGEASVKAGPKVELSVEFCGEVLKAKLSVGAGIEAKIKAELLATDTVVATADSIHACTLCLDGTINWYAEVNAGLSYKIIKDVIEGKLVDWDIVKVEGDFPISPNFYISIFNDEDSVLNGRLTFGWGKCPNESYKTEFVVKDSEGDELSNVDIVITTTAGENAGGGKSKLKVYLYKGNYEVSCNIGGVEIKKAFEVTDDAQTITLNANSNGTLSGKICKASDRITAIPGAKIEIFKDGVSYTTKYANENGNYSLKLAEGEYFVVISSEGYIDFKSYASVTVDTNTYMETFLMIEGEEGTIGTASGTVVNSLTGNGTPDVMLSVLTDWNNTSNNSSIIASTKTDAYGYYTIDLPIGNYTVMATKDNYTTAYFNIIVQEGTTGNQNGTITPVVAEGVGNQYLITLTWGENPRDLDSHVVGTLSSGSSFHVYYNHKSQYDGDTEVCNLDYDDTTSYGPEHTTLITTTDSPYYYYIHRYAGSGAIITSGAQITIEQGNTLIAKFNVPTDLSADDYWNVFAIKNGEIIINNTITTSPNTSYAD